MVPVLNSFMHSCNFFVLRSSVTRFEGISYLSSCWPAILDSMLCFCSGSYGVSPPPKVWEEFFRKKAFHGDERFWLIFGGMELMIRLCHGECFINTFSSNLNIANLIFFSYHDGKIKP